MEILSYLLGNFTDVDCSDIKHGAEAIVLRGALPSVQGNLAIKKWAHTYPDKDTKQRLIREVKLLMQNDHENIIKFLGVLINDQSEWIGYVMPYMEKGSLDEIIHNKNNKNYDDIYTNEQIKSWIIQISRGLSHLHSKNIIHRDIKPNNILLGEFYDAVKLSDFGMARSLESLTHSLTAGRGTLLYMPPEILKDNIYTFSVDIYSFSITIWEILYRRHPYDHVKNKFDLVNMVRSGERPQLDDNLSMKISQLLKECWRVDASERPKVNDIPQFWEKATLSLSTSLAENPSGSFDTSPPIEKSPGKETILLLGGLGGRDSLLMLENSMENWKQLSIKLPHGIWGHGAQFLNNNLYIFGGQNKKVQKFNLTYKLSKSLQWEKMADMKQKRSLISNSSVILNNQIWVCGGHNERETLKSVEMYDPLTNKWKYMKEMNECRYNAAAAVVNGKIFCSGWDRSVECYDPSDIWTYICYMAQLSWAHGAVEIDGNLIVMGGFLENVWALNTRDKNAVWIEKPSMSIPRMNFSIAKIDDKIFVCGGWNADDSVEIFDGEVWKNGPKMPTYRKYATAVAVPIELARVLKQFIVDPLKLEEKQSFESLEEEFLDWDDP